MKLPIRTRLTGAYAVMLALIMLGLAIFVVWQLRRDLLRTVDAELGTSSAVLARVWAAPESEFVAAARAALPEAGSAQVLDAEGRLLAQAGPVPGPGPLATPPQLGAARTAPVTATRRLGPDGQAYRVRATAVAQGQQQSRVLVVAVSLAETDEMVDRVVVLLLIAGPIAFAATVAVGFWLTDRALRPVRRITADADRIGVLDLHARVAVPPARDEIHRLGLTLNSMLTRIETGVLGQRRLVADASHELRTPLAVMRTELDVNLRDTRLPAEARDVLLSLREEVDRLAATVDNLLTLAAADEGRLSLLTRGTDLDDLVREVARTLGPVADAADVHLVVSGGAPPVQVDPQLLRLCVANLAANAVRASPHGGTVTLGIGSQDGAVEVTVSDHGPGIPDGDRERIFERFVRLDTARTRETAGSGLGLAICREVALAHGGEVTVADRAGPGSTFTLRLPAWRTLQNDVCG